MFWVDNFDCIIESVTGGGSVNTAHMMVFQEMNNSSSINQSDTNIARTKVHCQSCKGVKKWYQDRS